MHYMCIVYMQIRIADSGILFLVVNNNIVDTFNIVIF